MPAEVIIKTSNSPGGGVDGSCVRSVVDTGTAHTLGSSGRMGFRAGAEWYCRSFFGFIKKRLVRSFNGKEKKIQLKNKGTRKTGQG